jgi:hypothetical protein
MFHLSASAIAINAHTHTPILTVRQVQVVQLDNRNIIHVVDLTVILFVIQIVRIIGGLLATSGFSLHDQLPRRVTY